MQQGWSSTARETTKSTNSWKLNDTLLNGDWVKKKTNMKNFKFLELTENENIIYQNL